MEPKRPPIQLSDLILFLAGVACLISGAYMVGGQGGALMALGASLIYRDPQIRRN